MGGASIPYLLGSEIPNAALREKTQSLGTSWNVLWGFATNYSIPYIIAKINFQVGWVFGSIALLALIFTIFVLPETKVRQNLALRVYGISTHTHCLECRERRLKKWTRFLKSLSTLFDQTISRLRVG